MCACNQCTTLAQMNVLIRMSWSVHHSAWLCRRDHKFFLGGVRNWKRKYCAGERGIKNTRSAHHMLQRLDTLQPPLQYPWPLCVSFVWPLPVKNNKASTIAHVIFYAYSHYCVKFYRNLYIYSHYCLIRPTILPGQQRQRQLRRRPRQCQQLHPPPLLQTPRQPRRHPL